MSTPQLRMVDRIVAQRGRRKEIVLTNMDTVRLLHSMWGTSYLARPRGMLALRRQDGRLSCVGTSNGVDEPGRVRPEGPDAESPLRHGAQLPRRQHEVVVRQSNGRGVVERGGLLGRGVELGECFGGAWITSAEYCVEHSTRALQSGLCRR